MTLVIDLLFGLGKCKYFGRYSLRSEMTRLNRRGYSAGSYVGLALLKYLERTPLHCNR